MAANHLSSMEPGWASAICCPVQPPPSIISHNGRCKQSKAALRDLNQRVCKPRVCVGLFYVVTSLSELCSVAVFAEATAMPFLIQWKVCWESSLCVLRFEMILKKIFGEVQVKFNNIWIMKACGFFNLIFQSPLDLTWL